MRGSRLFCQRVSTFDNVFLLFFFIYLFLVDVGREDPSTTISEPMMAQHWLGSCNFSGDPDLYWRFGKAPQKSESHKTKMYLMCLKSVDYIQFQLAQICFKALVLVLSNNRTRMLRPYAPRHVIFNNVAF